MLLVYSLPLKGILFDTIQKVFLFIFTIFTSTGLETHHPSLLGFMMHDTTKKDDEVKEVKEEKEAKEEKVEKEVN